MVYLFMILAIFAALLFLAGDTMVKVLAWCYDRVTEAVDRTRNDK